MAKLNRGTFELYYEDSGGSKDPLVLLHGSWGDHHQWDAAVALLSKSFRVVSYDRRGHGASSAPGQSVVLADQLADLTALLTVVGGQPPHIVATGAGGIIALQLALARPDRVRSLNLHEPPLVGLLSSDPTAAAPYAGFREFEERLAARFRTGDRGGCAQDYVNGVLAEPGGWAQLPPAAQVAFAASAPVAMKEIQDPTSANMDLSLFATYRDPIVLTGGSRSMPAFAVINDHIAAAFYGILRYSFDGASHFPHVTHPDAFVRVVGEFCRYAAQRSS